MNNLRPITDEALDLIDATHDHIGWLTALMTAIRADAKHNKGRDLEKLTGLGQYLSSDWDHYLDGQSKRLRGQLDAVEVSL
ncbi:hypothetical protein [Pseudomonas sp. GL-RE-20]|uniref:hypothetical protein n=1 Tax=Pseudomonas sp. GL-RE-20 TaxID=2832372 RepID=UPI001CBBAE9F|nr:hypothetical protein [Pseudomonas sp. GL-RE-20]